MPRQVIGMMVDNRVELRRRILKTGKILFAQGTRMLDCTIRNISAKGAMLQIPNSIDVPKIPALRAERTAFARRPGGPTHQRDSRRRHHGHQEHR